jgi:sodium transport system permease protein
MGTGLNSSAALDEDHTALCYVENLPESFAPILDSIYFDTTPVTDLEAAKEAIAENYVHLLILFPADFDSAIAAAVQGGEIPNIQVYYNSGDLRSQMAYNAFNAVAAEYESTITNVMDINRDTEDVDLAKTASYYMTMLPMLVIMLLCNGCGSVAPESIAGEKERGTIATILVTPVSRTAIAIGKIASLSLFALLAGLSSFIGVMLSLPKMMGQGAGLGLDMYSISDYICLLLVIATTVLLLISIVSVLSAHAKSVKEAAASAGYLNMLSFAAGITQFFSIEFAGSVWRCVPILNSVLSLSDIFQLRYSYTDIIITCGTNLVLMAGFVILLSKMFNSEKAMFNK